MSIAGRDGNGEVARNAEAMLPSNVRRLLACHMGEVMVDGG